MDYTGGMLAGNRKAAATAVAERRLAASLGIVKMEEYLVTGTRKQFWEERFVKGVIQVSQLTFRVLFLFKFKWSIPHSKLQAVLDNEVDMKCGAQLLGVSYSSLYGHCKEAQTRQRPKNFMGRTKGLVLSNS